MREKLSTRQLAIIGVMTAVICIVAPFSIPIGVVPLSLSLFAIYLALYVLGMKRGTIAVLVYLCIGLAGLPVFSDFSGGPAKLFGPTGGYLIGYIPLAVIAGYFIDKYAEKWLLCLFGMVLGTAVCYLLGTLWLAFLADMDLKKALAIGVFPFIPGDLIKMAAAAFLGSKLRRQLKKAEG